MVIMEIETTVVYKVDTNRIVNLKEAIPHYTCVVCFSLLTDGVVVSKYYFIFNFRN